MTYKDKLKDPRWQKRRLEILSRDKFTCSFCGDKETTLHVHHFKYCKNPWESPDDDLCAICEHCHFIKHHEKNMSVLEKFLFDRAIGFYWGDIDFTKFKKDALMTWINTYRKEKIIIKKSVYDLIKNG